LFDNDPVSLAGSTIYNKFDVGEIAKGSYQDRCWRPAKNTNV